jgi:tungstate transport system substrate-binding protein
MTILATAALALPNAASALGGDPHNVVVQAGTTIRDSGLYANVIQPDLAALYPQYTFQWVFVGTGQALQNAEAGQGDAVFTHNPLAEQQFINDGYSYEPYGRYIMVSDFIVVGAKSDPAGVNANDPHDSVGAFEDIAAAGALGQADFVSRGDQSGTNLKELQIWALTNVPLNNEGEPGTPGTDQDAPWYHKTGQGQAATLSVADQCPFSSGSCYAIADRGTFNYLVGKGTITHLKMVSDQNNGCQPDPPGCPGGDSLLVNPYHAYAVNPAKFQDGYINLAGALALLDYLDSDQFQSEVASYPGGVPAFFPEAHPVLQTLGVPPTVVANTSVTVQGSVTVPFYLDDQSQLTGSPVQLWRSGDSNEPVSSTTVNADGTYSMTFTPTRSDTYSVVWPQWQDRRTTTKPAGSMEVQAFVKLKKAKPNGGLSVKVSGTALPATDRIAAEVDIQARKAGKKQFTTFATIPMPEGQSAYSTTITLSSSGTWVIRAEYIDQGAVTSEFSKSMRVSL